MIQAIPSRFLRLSRTRQELTANLLRHDVLNAIAGLGAATTVLRRRAGAAAEPAVAAMEARLQTLERSLHDFSTAVEPRRQANDVGSALRCAGAWLDASLEFDLEDGASLEADPAFVDLLCFLLLGASGASRVVLRGSVLTVEGGELTPLDDRLVRRLVKEIGGSFHEGSPLTIHLV